MDKPIGWISRRKFLKTAALGAAATTTFTWPRSAFASPADDRHGIVPLDDWLFGGEMVDGATAPDFNDAGFGRVTLPHCVAKLSWQNWDYKEWEKIWIYRHHFTPPREWNKKRVFLHFEGVMVGNKPVINGHELPGRLGGYLPSQCELTEWLKEGENILAVVVDSRWSQCPPEGSPKGPSRIDYLEPGGIYRPARLEIVPQIFISDVFAKPVDVLNPSRAVEVACTINAGAEARTIELLVELKDKDRVLATERQALAAAVSPGETTAHLTLRNLGNVNLWHVKTPRLYHVVATLLVDGKPVHHYTRRIGFREARFEVDGFFLNGERFRFMGLDRHELYPYVGGAMPRRVLRRDAELLRREFNCDIVRCSHYPQSEAFLDACDELGMMVWEEPPGWGYMGDEQWRDLVVRDVGEMIKRDRNHPAIVIWGVRVNESNNDNALYQRTTALARTLDGSRPCSGSMTTHKNWRQNWHEDVFSMDDYHSTPDGQVAIYPPLPGVPYMLSETVGQYNYTDRKTFNAKYRRAGDVQLQTAQAVRHAQAHNNALNYERFCGVIAWCAIDYGSLVNPYHNVKCPGVADVFRIPKLGASFYQAQTDPGADPVIAPNFFWDFGADTPRGPGMKSSVFSNCERLEFFVDGKSVGSAQPDKTNYPHVKHAPFFVDLDFDGGAHPELRIAGFMGDREVISRKFSSDPARDQFVLKADDKELVADGADATRLMFGQMDAYGNPRLKGGGEVAFAVEGPGKLVGDNPFQLADPGGVGAVWIRTLPRETGHITVTARHSTLGEQTVHIKVIRPSAEA